MPAMSLAAASAWLLSIYFSRLQRRWLILSGLLFGCALQVKLTAGIFLPAMAAEFLRRGGWGHRPMDSVRGVMPGGGAPPKTGLELKAASPEGSQAGQINPHPSPSGLAPCPAFSLRQAFAWLMSAVAAFGAVVAAFCPIEAFKVFWLSHFSGGTLDAAAAAQFAFHIRPLLDNPCLVPAAAGLAVIFRGRRWDLLFPAVLFATVLAVHLWHRPYWEYYELHFQAPLAWLAAIGIVEWFRALWRAPWPRTLLGKSRLTAGALGWSAAFSVAMVLAPVAMWNGLTALKSVELARSNPRVLALARHASETRWVFTHNLIAAFWAGLPVPPNLAVIPAKRIWSGQISNEEVLASLKLYRPEQVLLWNNWAREFGLSAYLRSNYHPGGSPQLLLRNAARSDPPQ